MTREHKLALIVGFSLILLVGVLISDHLSKARLAKVSPVGGTETSLVDSNLPPTTDPLKVLNSVVSQLPPAPAPAASNPAPAAPQNTLASGQLTSQPGTQPAAMGPAPTSPNTLANGGPSVQPIEPPTVLTQGRHSGPENDPALQREIERAGGQLVRGSDGTIIAQLPAAAGVKSGKKTAPETVKPEAGKNLASPESRTVEVAAKTTPTTVETQVLHKVQKGETLYMIAAKYYGTGHVWRELAKYNSVETKNGSVRVGAQLKIPSKDVLLGKPASTPSSTATVNNTPTAKPAPAKKPEVTPGKPPRIELATYTVKKGDTLGTISQKVLGTSKRWEEIADLNKIDDETGLAAGQVLKVPAMRG